MSSPTYVVSNDFPAISMVAQQNAPTIQPPLPAELCDAIIDAVAAYGRTEDLIACKLASRFFLHRTRRYLHRIVRLRSHSDIREFESLFTAQYLLPYVQKVAIAGCATMVFADGHDCTEMHLGIRRPDHIWITHLLPCLGRLRGVRCLELCDLSWGDVSRDARDFIISNFPSVTQLVLRGVDFWSMREFFRTLDAFSHVSNLNACMISCHRPNFTTHQITATTPLKFSHLMLLGVRRMRYYPLVLWLLGNRIRVEVAHARIVWEDMDLIYLIDLLRKLAPSLVSLNLHKTIRLPAWFAVSSTAHHAPIPLINEIEEMRRRQFSAFDADESEQSALQAGGTLPADPGVSRALSVLEEYPIVNSSLRHLTVTIFWRHFHDAIFTLKLASQIISDRTTRIVIHIRMATNWLFMPWPLIDMCLAEVAMNARSTRCRSFTLTLEMVYNSVAGKHWDAEIIRNSLARTRNVFTSISVIPNTAFFKPKTASNCP